MSIVLRLFLAASFVMVAVTGSSAPRLGEVSESPLEEQQETQEQAVQLRRRLAGEPRPTGTERTLAAISLRGCSAWPRLLFRWIPAAGHSLPNGLPAPLQC